MIFIHAPLLSGIGQVVKQYCELVQGTLVDFTDDFRIKIPNNSGGEENVILYEHQIPPHTHSEYYTQIGNTGINAGNGGRSVANTHLFAQQPTGTTGGGQSHNNMPPYWILIYIMKTSTYNFDYD
jgi:microcystin-dependent protein